MNTIKIRGLLTYYILLGIFFVAGTVATVIVYNKTIDDNNATLLRQANTMAQLVGAEAVAELNGNALDLENENYLALKERMMDVRTVNKSLRFIYIMGMRGDEVFFFVDSEPDDSEDYSPPGQVYDEATPLLKSIFQTGQGMTEGPEPDRWGVWISGLVPLIDKDTGEVVGVFGIDRNNDEFDKALFANTAVPIIITCIFLILLVFVIVLHRRQMNYLAKTCKRT